MTNGAHPLYQRIFYILASVTLGGLILISGSTFFIPFVLGAFLAMLLVPITEWLERIKAGRFLAAFLPVVGMIAALVTLFGLAAGQVGSIASNLEATDRISEEINRINRYLMWNFRLAEPAIPDFDGQQVIRFLKGYSAVFLTALGGFAGTIFALTLVPIATFFYLYYRDHLLEFLVRWMHRHPRNFVEEKAQQSRQVAERYLTGLLKVVGILAILNSAALFLLRVEHALFFGIFAAFLNLIPYFGPIFGSILPTLYVFLTTEGTVYKTLAVIGVFIIIQAIESNILTPKIVGGNVRLNPMITFAGLIAGGLLWGVIGMLIAIPSLAILMRLLHLSPDTRPFAFLLGSSN